jgi:hypothetical protein
MVNPSFRINLATMFASAELPGQRRQRGRIKAPGDQQLPESHTPLGRCSSLAPKSASCEKFVPGRVKRIALRTILIFRFAGYSSGSSAALFVTTHAVLIEDLSELCHACFAVPPRSGIDHGVEMPRDGSGRNRMSPGRNGPLPT